MSDFGKIAYKCQIIHKSGPSKRDLIEEVNKLGLPEEHKLTWL